MRCLSEISASYWNMTDSRYHGWQRQQDDLTIQQVLEEALERLTGEPVKLIGSGRTDAGVHALGQVANFRTGSTIPLKAFHAGLNSMLPYDIAVLEAREVPPEFHVRKSALSKTYEYRLLNRPSRSPLHHRYGWWLAHELDLDAMAAAAALLSGEHDFSAFRASGQRQPEPGAADFCGRLADSPRRLVALYHHRQRLPAGHGPEPGGHHGGSGQGQGRTFAAGWSCCEPASAAGPAPPPRPRGYIWCGWNINRRGAEDAEKPG